MSMMYGMNKLKKEQLWRSLMQVQNVLIDMGRQSPCGDKGDESNAKDGDGDEFGEDSESDESINDESDVKVEDG